MKKWIIGSLIFIAVIAIYWAFNYDRFQLEKKGAYQYVIEGDKDDIYERALLVEKVKSEKELHQLLFALLDKKNRDLLSKHTAIAYVGNNQMKNFLPYLKLVQKDFESMGFDSDTIVEISPGRFRRSELKRDAHVVELLNNAITSLSK